MISPPPPFVPEDSIVWGVSASPGVAIGEACLLARKRRAAPRRRKLGNHKEAERELQRLMEAKARVSRQLTSARDSLPEELSSQAGIFDAHLLLLNDPLLQESTADIIKNELLNAEWAVFETVKKISRRFSQVQDAYIRSRVTDVEQVGRYLIDALSGGGDRNLDDCPSGSILLAPDLNPADVVKLSAIDIAGLVTEKGSRTSHTAIMAQALELPAVVGAQKLLPRVSDGDTIIIDGDAGLVIVRPEADVINYYRGRQRLEAAFQAEIVRCAHLPAVTLDDRRIEVLGNLELIEELPAILSYGGDGIGLYRTEFLYLTRTTPPSEDELFNVYRQVVESAAPRPVTIRTLDVGLDKNWEQNGRDSDSGPAHQASALGLRGIRYCLKQLDIFKTQLRAILRASVFGDLRVMLPMITSLDELRRSKELLAEVSASLDHDGLEHRADISLGIMIEVPSAVIMAAELAREADFFSIGTNDLIQYTLAVDRSNPEVAYLYQPLHPAILRMIKMVIDAGRDSGTPVSICGDMAAGAVTAPVLAGLGAGILSMPPTAIPRIKRILRMSSQREMSSWAEAGLSSSSSREAFGHISAAISQKFPEFF